MALVGFLVFVFCFWYVLGFVLCFMCLVCFGGGFRVFWCCLYSVLKKK